MNCSSAKTLIVDRSISSSSLLCKSNFIWRFPQSKFVELPSCSLSLDQRMNIDEELIHRQELSILIYELAFELHVSFNCIYTAIIYMHRFFMIHSFQRFVKELVAIACLFLSCKVNDMPRLLSSFHRYLTSTMINENHLTNESILNHYNQQIIDYENILLSTLGFSLQVEQPYSIITKTIQFFSNEYRFERFSSDITQQANEIITKCIFFTYFPMKYTINRIACFALHLALISSNIQLPENNDGSQWFHSLNEEFNEKILQELIDEYRSIMMKESTKIFEQRFERIRREKENVLQGSSKVKSIPSTSTSMCPTNESDVHLSTVITTNENLSTHSNGYSTQETYPISHQTPTRSSFHYSQMNYSPYSLPHHQPTPTPSNSSISSAKPIPTLMSSSNSVYLRQSSRFAPPTFKYPITSTTSQYHFRPPYLPMNNSHYSHCHPSSTSTSTSTTTTTHQHCHSSSSIYYPQQQTPLFYHPTIDPSSMNLKRYGEPPGPPTKRLRYHIPMQQPY